MEEENTGTMNLDLNLGPLDNSSDDGGEPGSRSRSYPTVAMNLEDWLGGPVHTVRGPIRQGSHRWRSLWRQVPIPPETRNLALELISGNQSQMGEGSIAPEERQPMEEVAKMCENGNGYIEDESLSRKEENGKNNSDEGSFFDCNICLELAKDPVLTCCGHLFCWPCLYRWLHLHSDAKECPVCKGEVTLKSVTPIYGRGTNKRETNVDYSSLKIPTRPQARRVESWRQAIQRTEFTIPMEEMIRRLGSTFDLSRELAQIQNRDEGPRESPERANSLLNRILTSRAMRRERAPAVPSDDVIDLTESSPPNYEVRENQNRRLSSLLLRRSNSNRVASLAANLSAESLAAERLVESYFHSNPLVERNRNLTSGGVDDRDSVSSIAAVIHSESQTVDNAIEIDSTVSFSTSTSRRRNDASRISDVDSGDSRAPRRRRLN
ncbi:hypothetical protein ACJIZ3_003627 [Penstemon smallii]|uniref:E3 ubiquitin-protein ligase RMA n=1 Tax=Penstemon smallii TaxID=265156 RepID=A0ABD3U9R5_9LAMI